MPRPPYMSFPFSFYRPPYKVQQNFRNSEKTTINSNSAAEPLPPTNIAYKEIHYTENNNRNYEQKNKSNKYNDDCLFDLFGLKIYSDDVLLVSLIYFLYSENVKDD